MRWLVADWFGTWYSYRDDEMTVVIYPDSSVWSGLLLVVGLGVITDLLRWQML
jgi:hypothetical protein